VSTEVFDWNRAMHRRLFIKGMGWVSGALLLSTLGGCEGCIEKIKNRPIRRRLRAGSPEVDAVIATYKQAVTAMKALPATDPRSWSAQAGIHGTVAGGFNFCQHGSNHFFSWHRAYLLYFEQICQELTGDDRFGLPYWNWNQDAQMHAAFTDPVSPLNHPRNNTSVGNDPAFSDATMDTILGDGNFFTFSSQLEGSPHNMAHVIVGKDMVSGGSPLDPIFWAHHCMVDYCWAKWNIELGNDNTNDPGWNQTGWDHFVDRNGNPVSNVTAGITTLMPLLSYQYESSAIGSAPAKATLSAAAFRKVEKRLREGAEVRLEIKKRIRIAERAAVSMARPLAVSTSVSADEFAAIVESDAARERIFTRIDYARLPSTNDFFVRVFLNLPAADGSTSTDDAHYAGSFAFFGTHDPGEEGHGGKREFLVDVTDTLQGLKGRGELTSGNALSVQLVAVPVTGKFAQPEAELVVEQLDLIVTPVVIRSRQD
jgi:tyrosinase